MAYDDNICACGSRSKMPGELLCSACRDALGDADALTEYLDTGNSTAIRRAAAIFLLRLARQQRRGQGWGGAR